MKTHAEISSFKETGLSKEIINIVDSLGFEEPTPVQKLAIPIILGGKNLVAQAPTGTGKTLAFGLPLMEIIENRKNPFAIVLVPTRELCMQVAQELNRVGSLRRVFTVPIYGGKSIDNQIKALKRGVQVIVGTPGRVIDHLERGTLVLSDVGYVVLDEADEMLDMGFEEDIERIMKRVPATSQRMLFSATMPSAILEIAKKYIKNYEKVMLSRENIVVPSIKQILYEVRENDKPDMLTRILDTEVGDLVLIFCHTKKETDEVAYFLKNRGYTAEALHGDYSQAQRERVMDQFRKKRINILVATDVAARGIDVTDISHVINFSIPQDPERYIHRIGRTGRAGKTGVAITFVTPAEYRRIRDIERVTKSKITKTAAPEMAELIEIKKNNYLSKLSEITEKEKKMIVSLEDTFIEALEDKDVLRLMIASFLLHAGIESTPERGRESGYKKLFVTLGKKDGITAKDIFKGFIEKGGLKGDDIGRIHILEKFTFVEVREQVAETIISAVQQLVVKGKTGKVMRAKDKQ